jgi:glycosyltransferase involved in cell wall biosynthesis
MKVAFVNQPFDAILPPNQNSVGGCTYGAAKALSRFCSISIFGMQDSQHALAPEPKDVQLSCHFIESHPVDRWIFEAMRKYRRVAPRAPLLSVSDRLYPHYGCQVAEALRDEDCDVIHVQHSTQYLPIIRKLNPHALIVLQMHAEWFSQSSASVFLERVRHADLITGVSRYVVEKTRRAFPEIEDRCRVFYNGIDPGEFLSEKDYASARLRGIKRILYAGAVSPHRGLHVLMKAFNMVARRYPNVQLELVGPNAIYPLFEIVDKGDEPMVAAMSPYYSSEALSLIRRKLFHSSHSQDYAGTLQAMLDAESSEKVSFRGFIGDRKTLLSYFQDADVFVFPSLCNDSFGIPVVEAMASGVPVVATRSGGVVEIVQDGLTGTIVDKNDADSLGAALLAYLEDDHLRERAGRAARARALETFTWDRAAEQMLAEYRGMLSHSSLGARDRDSSSLLRLTGPTTLPRI